MGVLDGLISPGGWGGFGCCGSRGLAPGTSISEVVANLIHTTSPRSPPHVQGQPASSMIPARFSGEFSNRLHQSLSPSSLSHTANERRRRRSDPDTLPSRASSLVREIEPPGYCRVTDERGGPARSWNHLWAGGFEHVRTRWRVGEDVSDEVANLCDVQADADE